MIFVTMLRDERALVSEATLSYRVCSSFSFSMFQNLCSIMQCFCLQATGSRFVFAQHLVKRRRVPLVCIKVRALKLSTAVNLPMICAATSLDCYCGKFKIRPECKQGLCQVVDVLEICLFGVGFPALPAQSLDRSVLGPQIKEEPTVVVDPQGTH